jgi:hypothetical protein
MANAIPVTPTSKTPSTTIYIAVDTISSFYKDTFGNTNIIFIPGIPSIIVTETVAALATLVG